MKKLMIEGGRELKGTVNISGAKNSSVAIIPATILSNTPVEINGLPNISDVHTLRGLLEDIGGEASLEKDTLTVNPERMAFKRLINEKAQKLRASYYFMGAMLGKFKEAYIGLPGGCHLGPRPIDQHLKGFKALGAEVDITTQGIYLSAEKLEGTDIHLDIASVGATINIMLAAVKAEGKTVIENAAQEPEIVDVATFLSHMGAKITGAGTNTIHIEGVAELNGSQHTVIPDRIEAGTYMIMASGIGDKVIINNIVSEHLEPLIAKLREMGANIEIDGNQAIITKGKKLTSVDVKTLVHPGFPTDLQQPFTALLTQTEGVGTVTDTIYNERFKQIYELHKMGAEAKVKDNTATITGPNKLHGAKVEASDLRAGAALVIAGLIAEGVTSITGIDHIERGYEDIVEKLTNLGANVWRETQVEHKFQKSHFPSPVLNQIPLAEGQLLR